LEGSSFSVHSVDSDRELVFRDRNGERFTVELKGSELFGSVDVWLHPVANDLHIFFQELAGFPNAWQGARAWESLEGELSLSATCSTLGQVTFFVKFYHRAGSPEDWEVRARLVTELGQLEKIAKEAKIFFRVESA
jgi:hypothetical protein